MDSLIHRLQEKLKQNPPSPNYERIQRVLSRLADVDTNKEVDEVTRDALKIDFEALQKEGLVDSNDISVLAALQPLKAASEPSIHAAQSPAQIPHGVNQFSADDMRYVQANLADSTVPRLTVSDDTPTVLPLELIEALNQTYFLHMLATDPARVLPAGKSLISVLSRPHSAAQDGASALQKQVENMVHAAFWQEAYESLSNPVPSVQLPRLKGLYQDLHTVLSPLLPSTHPVIVTLSLPLSPTSSPLRSAITHLREILQSLRERCAPSRDAQVDSLISKLDDDVNPTTDLARVVVGVVRAILNLAEEMKDDLSQFVLGSLGEQQLHEVVVAQTAARERELTLQLWRPHRLREMWMKWLEEAQLPPGDHTLMTLRERFVYRLMQALGKNEAVFCDLPVITVNLTGPGAERARSPSPSNTADVPHNDNRLPPPLFFATATLLQLQNYLQALVIAASLRSLVRLPPSRALSSPSRTEAAASTPTQDSAQGFMDRIWTLLKDEIDGQPAADGIKVVNLADEVVRVRRLYGAAVEADEEAKLRATVDRTLQVKDPVFQLLQRRLVRAIAERLAESRAAGKLAAPERLRAGRQGTADDSKRLGRPVMSLDLGNAKQVASGSKKQRPGETEPITVKGFEDRVLVLAVGEVAARIQRCVDWTEFVWSDLFEKQAGIDGSK